LLTARSGSGKRTSLRLPEPERAFIMRQAQALSAHACDVRILENSVDPSSTIAGLTKIIHMQMVE